MTENQKTKSPSIIKIRDKSFHTKLKILKDLNNHKSLEVTVKFLYHAHRAKYDAFIKDLLAIKNINHPKHTQEIIDKWRNQNEST